MVIRDSGHRCGIPLSVFKLVSCKPGASRELAYTQRPPRPEKPKMF